MDIIHITGTELIWLVIAVGILFYGWMWIPRTKRLKASPQEGLDWMAEEGEGGHMSEVTLSISQQLTDVSKQLNEVAMSFSKMQREIYIKFDSINKRLEEGNARFTRIENTLVDVQKQLGERQ